MQSVHACAVQTHCLLFALVQEKGFQKSAKWVNFGVISGFKYDIWCGKGGPKKWFQKRVPPRVKRQTIPGSGGPWSSGLACALFEQETVVRAAAEALFEILAEKGGLGSTFLQKNVVWAQNRCKKTDWTAESLQRNEGTAEKCRLLTITANVEMESVETIVEVSNPCLCVVSCSRVGVLTRPGLRPGELVVLRNL